MTQFTGRKKNPNARFILGAGIMMVRDNDGHSSTGVTLAAL